MALSLDEVITSVGIDAIRGIIVDADNRERFDEVVRVAVTYALTNVRVADSNLNPANNFANEELFVQWAAFCAIDHLRVKNYGWPVEWATRQRIDDMVIEISLLFTPLGNLSA